MFNTTCGSKSLKELEFMLLMMHMLVVLVQQSMIPGMQGYLRQTVMSLALDKNLEVTYISNCKPKTETVLQSTRLKLKEHNAFCSTCCTEIRMYRDYKQQFILYSKR
jgi:hypothetical protein